MTKKKNVRTENRDKKVRLRRGKGERAFGFSGDMNLEGNEESSILQCKNSQTILTGDIAGLFGQNRKAFQQCGVFFE